MKCWWGSSVVAAAGHPPQHLGAPQVPRRAHAFHPSYRARARSCRPPSMKSRPDAPIRADLVGTSRVEHHDLTSEECSEVESPLADRRLRTVTCPGRFPIAPLTLLGRSPGCAGCVSCGDGYLPSPLTVPGDPSRRARPSGSGASANQDVARRQAPQRNTTVNARRIACVNARALKRFTVGTTSKSQR